MNRDKVLGRVFPDLRAPYTTRDTILYALGIGAMQDPMDTRELRWVYERVDLQAMPSMSCVLAHPGHWTAEPALEIDWVRLLHAEQSFDLQRPLPADGLVIGSYRITGLVDKGPEKGALLYLQKTLRLENGDAIGTVGSTYFMRGDGGCGNWGEAEPELPVVPARPADGSIDLPTSPVAALIYRLSGDPNPLHADPAVAKKAGFERPILHGLCTYGVACQSLVRGLCDFDASRLRGMRARFTRPVYPGDTIRTQWWNEAYGTVRFQSTSVQRNEVVLDRGAARIVP
jgi:acyl dehydratase